MKKIAENQETRKRKSLNVEREDVTEVEEGKERQEKERKEEETGKRKAKRD